MASIILEHVDKVYANGHVAARDLNLAIRHGELLVLVGPSGSGKSTVLRLIAGLERPTSGRILIDDEDMTVVPPERRDLAMVFQSYALYPHKSVRENLAFGLRMRRLGATQIRERVQQAA
ncbi:MAG: ABC transporter ATP-binding protein, partial [Acidobacteria bacterium]|nr:ABC transporter ATP-binding protein [Acidobacteriota bacterium]